jgi:hypothetical protein
VDVLVGALSLCFIAALLGVTVFVAVSLAVIVPIAGVVGVPALWVAFLDELWVITGGGRRGRALLAVMPPLALVLWCLPGGPDLAGAAIVGLLWGAVGRRVLQDEPRLPPPPSDSVDLAPDPRWRLAWWTLASVLVGLTWVHWGLFLVALVALAAGCVRARRTLVVLPRGVRVIERLPWATREHWVEADRVWCEPAATWWGGRVQVSRGLAVRTGELPPVEWLWQVAAHARRVAPHTVASPGRTALQQLVAHGQG